MLYTKFQPNISNGSGEKVDFSGLHVVIFNNSGHFFILYLTLRLCNFFHALLN